MIFICGFCVCVHLRSTMIIPVRCFTCGKLISHRWNEYSLRISGGDDPADILSDMGYSRYCCRRMFLTNVDITESIQGNRRHEELPKEAPPPPCAAES